MKKVAGPGGLFDGQDYAQQGKGALPGQGRLPMPKPPAPPVAPAPRPVTPTPTQQRPSPTAAGAVTGMAMQQARPGQPQAQPQQDQGFNFRSPQMFGMLAGAMRPLTEGVMQYGGLPAIAGLYGLFTGNKDWTTATTKQQQQGVGTNLLQMQKPANFRLPLPVQINGELRMPRIS